MGKAMTTYQIYSTGRYHGERIAASFCMACYELAADDHAFKRYFNPLRLTFNGVALSPKGCA